MAMKNELRKALARASAKHATELEMTVATAVEQEKALARANMESALGALKLDKAKATFAEKKAAATRSFRKLAPSRVDDDPKEIGDPFHYHIASKDTSPYPVDAMNTKVVQKKLDNAAVAHAKAAVASEAAQLELKMEMMNALSQLKASDAARLEQAFDVAMNRQKTLNRAETELAIAASVEASVSTTNEVESKAAGRAETPTSKPTGAEEEERSGFFAMPSRLLNQRRSSLSTPRSVPKGLSFTALSSRSPGSRRASVGSSVDTRGLAFVDVTSPGTRFEDMKNALVSEEKANAYEIAPTVTGAATGLKKSSSVPIPGSLVAFSAAEEPGVEDWPG